MGHDHSIEKRRYALSARIAFLAGTIFLFAALFILTAVGVGDATHLIADGFVSLVSWKISSNVEQNHDQEAVIRRRGAYVQATLLVVAAAIIVVETYLHEHEPRSALQMMALGAASTMVALWRFSIVHPEWRRSITGKGEVWHVAIDLGTSVTVAIAGFLLWYFAIPAIDRWAGYAVAAIAVLGAAHLVWTAKQESATERRP